MSEDFNLVRQLTDRQMDVLEYIAKGLSDTEIAAKFGINIQTVKRHVSDIKDCFNERKRIKVALYTVKSPILVAAINERSKKRREISNKQV